MADLAKLVVRLEAQTAQYQAELEKARRQLSRFQVDGSAIMGRIGASFVALGASAAIGLGFLIKKQIDAADQANDLSKRLGITTEDISRLGYAAKQSGTSQDALVIGLQHLAKEAATAGVSMNQAIADIADKFSKLPDGPEKTALAIKYLGRSGAELIPLFNEGAAGLKKFADESDRFGATISGKAAADADRFNDTIGRLKEQAAGFGNKLAEGVLPQMQKFLDKLTDPEVQAGIISFANLILKIGSAAVTALSAMAKFASYLPIFIVAKKAIGLLGSSDSAAAPPAFRGNGALDGSSGQRKHLALTLSDDTAAKNHLKEMIAALKEQEQTFGQNATQIELYKLAMAGANNKQLELAASSLKHIEILKEQADALSEVADIFERTRTPAEQFAAQIKRLGELRNARNAQGDPILDQETYRRAVEQAQVQFDELTKKAHDAGKTMTEYWVEAAHNMQDAFAQFLFDPFKDGLDGMLKNFGRVIQQMVAQAAAAQIFSSLGINSLFASIGAGAGAAPTHHAAGGGFGANEPIIVGERGPELLVPSMAGYIVPNDKLSKTGGMTQIFNISTPDADSFRSSQRQIQRAGRRGLGL
jgi:hypothetical protein